MIRLINILLLMFIAATRSSRFRYDYEYIDEAHGWLKFVDVPADWHEARLRCHLEGTYLASPLNTGLRQAMQTQIEFKGKSHIFTGIHATFSRGDFFSNEGIPLSKTHHSWAVGQPDNRNNQESCLTMNSDGHLEDVTCDSVYPYMCYLNASKELVTNACGTVDNEYVLYDRTNKCYKFHRVPRTWSRAYMTCAAEGGSLVIINSEKEAEVLREIFAANPAGSMVGNFWKDVAFVGIHDWGEHGEWLTVEGQTLDQAGYNKFSPGEWNNQTTGEFCGAIYRTALYDDLNCEKISAFICEKSPDSLLRQDEN